MPAGMPDATSPPLFLPQEEIPQRNGKQQGEHQRIQQYHQALHDHHLGTPGADRQLELLDGAAEDRSAHHAADRQRHRRHRRAELAHLGAAGGRFRRFVLKALPLAAPAPYVHQQQRREAHAHHRQAITQRRCYQQRDGAGRQGKRQPGGNQRMHRMLRPRRRAADPPHAVTQRNHQAQPEAERRQQQLIRQAEQNAHVGVDAPAGQLGNEREGVEPHLVDDGEALRRDGNRVHLRRPAAIHFGYRPGFALAFRLAQLDLSGVYSGGARGVQRPIPIAVQRIGLRG